MIERPPVSRSDVKLRRATVPSHTNSDTPHVLSTTASGIQNITGLLSHIDVDELAEEASNEVSI